MAVSQFRTSSRLTLALLCLAAAMLATTVVAAPASAKKPAWAGHTYTGPAKLQIGGRVLGTAKLKVADDGKSLTYSVPWTCDGFSQTAKKKVPVKSDGSFKGGVSVHTGSPGISYFIDGHFTSSRAKSAIGDLSASWHNFIAPNEFEEGCETGSDLNPVTVFTVKKK